MADLNDTRKQAECSARSNEQISSAKGETYRRAGVDIEAGEQAVELIREYVRSTFRPEVLTGIGGFGGLFSFDKESYQKPVLVSSTDGVGTKLKIAQQLDKHDTVGIDLVAMCVNDVVVQGAEPLFFLDYLAMGKLVPQKVAEIVKGIAYGCKQAGCALIGGETAEMPGFYRPDQYDLAGFAVGVVDESNLIDGSAIACGDVILGLASSGLHSNGYSLVRKILLEQEKIDLGEVITELGCSLADELLKPTKVYAKSVLKLIKVCDVGGLTHITGGGFNNISRILPDSLDATLDRSSWDIPPIFELVRDKGDVALEEMFQTFNMGIGMAAILPSKDAKKAVDTLTKVGEKVFKIGRIERGKGTVRFN